LRKDALSSKGHLLLLTRLKKESSIGSRSRSIGRKRCSRCSDKLEYLRKRRLNNFRSRRKGLRL
jgi:hypothetical protein